MKFATQFKQQEYDFSPICTDDAPALFNAVNSDCFPKSLHLAKLESLEQAQQWCSDRASDWHSGHNYVWSCRLTNSSKIVGQVSLYPQSDYLALAYWVEPESWGRGAATAMCRSLLAHIQANGYRGKVWAGVHKWNQRSAAVVEKLGFNGIQSNEEDLLEYILEISAECVSCLTT